MLINVKALLSAAQRVLLILNQKIHYVNFNLF